MNGRMEGMDWEWKNGLKTEEGSPWNGMEGILPCLSPAVVSDGLERTAEAAAGLW